MYSQLDYFLYLIKSEYPTFSVLDLCCTGMPPDWFKLLEHLIWISLVFFSFFLCFLFFFFFGGGGGGVRVKVLVGVINLNKKVSIFGLLLTRRDKN